ncbi:MAG TPA: 2Fe-2S iron-sulfur cluster-binding protein [Thermoguttaceae bacterium]|nr:2Fe-2S iron-sulfur cluster-binding protein [Thermoguttaceae bacterium]
MAVVTIDQHEITIPDARRLNVIEAARLVGIEIPHYCWHPGLSVVGSCRMCLVEMGRRDPRTGKVEMLEKLVPACSTPAQDGMVIVTDSEKVRRARAMVEEGLLLRHPIDCPICDKAGECSLQDFHFKYGQGERRADLRPFTSRRRDVGDVTLFVDRCVMCSRCVRFAAEVSGTHELMVTRRGAREEIDVVDGFPLANNLSGNVVDLCPVGALCDKDFLYRQRVWYMRKHPGVCTGCATGCSIWVEENQDRIYRLRPRENRLVNKWWICNEGRYGYHHVHDPGRLIRPRRREGESTIELDWTTLPSELESRLKRAGRLAVVLSPHLTVEEAYLLCKFVRQIDRQAALVLGPIPTVGADEHFPGGFTVSAEKCPNRRGVEAIVAHFSDRMTMFEEFLPELERGRIRGVWVAGGYKTDWIDETTARRFDAVEVLVVQDLFPSLLGIGAEIGGARFHRARHVGNVPHSQRHVGNVPHSQRATYELPAAAFAERNGSYVNRGDRLQSAPWAIRPPAGVRTEGSLFWELLGRAGLYDARAVLNEVAREILYFSAALGPLPDVGIDLKVNLLANDDKSTI